MRFFSPPSPLALTLVACALLPAAAMALDYPARKPGLWEVRIGNGDTQHKGPPQVFQQCLDATTDQALRNMGQQGAGQRSCSKEELHHDGDRLVVDSVCRMGASTATSHTVVTGDFSSSYRMETHNNYQPPLGGRPEGSVTIEAKWLGACQAGQKPGDVIMPGGMKMNVLDMGRMRKP